MPGLVGSGNDAIVPMGPTGRRPMNSMPAAVSAGDDFREHAPARRRDGIIGRFRLFKTPTRRTSASE
jgi:hypothetical protein